jgi:hypothetical protein
MASSDPVETANFLLEVLSGVEVMTSVKLSNEGAGRVFRFNAVFEQGDTEVVRKCITGLGS